MKKQAIISGIILLLLAANLCGCSEKGVVVGTGEIKYIDLEGGFYGIVSDNGEHYDSINLPLEFKEDSLQVKFILKILGNQSSIHMWGTVVEILEIKKL